MANDVEVVVLTKIETDTSQAVKASEDLEKQQEKTADATDELTTSTEDYNGALDSLLGSMGILPASMQKGLKGATSLTKGFKGLRAAIIATGIGALIVALGALFTWFNRTEEGANKLSVIMAYIGQIVDVLLDSFANLGEGIFKAFEDPKAAIAGLWEAIKTNLVNRVKGIIDLFGGLGRAIQAALSFDWDTMKEELKDVGTALIQINTGLDAEQQAAAIDKLTGKWKEMSASIREAGELQIRANDLEREQIKNITEEAELRVKISENRLKANQAELGITEQLKASNAALADTEKLFDKRIELQEEEVAILKERQALGHNTIQDNREMAQAEAALIELAKQRDDQLRSITTKNATLRNAVQKEHEEEAERIVQEWEAIEERHERSLEQIEELKLAERERLASETEDFRTKEQLLIEIENERLAKQLENRELLSSEVEALEIAHDNKLNKIRDDSAKSQIKLDNDVAANKVAQEQQAVVLITQMIGQMNAENKAAAVTNVLISTAVALIAAWRQGSMAIALLSTAAIGITSISSLNEISKASRGAMIGGKSHAFGGTLIEGERGEAIVNKTTMSDPYLASLVSAANVAGGGIPLAQDGMLIGQAQNASAITTMSRDIQRALAQMPPVMILEDFHAINNRVAIRENIGTF